MESARRMEAERRDPVRVAGGGPALWAVSRYEALVLLGCVVVGALLRLDFMRAARWTIDGDEAIVGLMGKHILEGRNIPVFYYGQHYMGSLEAIMASVSFFLFGMTPFTLQLVPLVWSLLLIPVVFLLARSLSSSRGGIAAALVTAVPPPALLVWSSKARGGFIEVVVLGAVALLIMVAWMRTSPTRLRYPIALGFVLGVGWWVNNQIAYFMAPIGIFSFLFLLRGDGGGGSRLVSRLMIVGIAGVSAFLVGGFPYWAYNLKHGFPSAGMFGLAEWEVFREHLRGLRNVALPILVGAQRFWQKEPAFLGATQIAYLLYVVPIAVLCLARWRAWFSLAIAKVDRERPVELVVLFCAACCLIFAVSSYGWLVQAPRYLLPMYVGLFVIVGVVAHNLWRASRAAGVAYVALVLAFHLMGSYWNGRAVTGEPVAFAGQRVAKDHGPVIETLDGLGIREIRTNYWIGYRLAFETGELITFVVLNEPNQIRIPEYQDTAPTPHRLVPLLLVSTELPIVKPALRRLGIEYSEVQAGEYTVLFNLREVYPDVAALPRDVMTDVEGVGKNDPRAAIDGSSQTRWGTGAPQSPGQSFRVDLAPHTRISGFEYEFGAWPFDMAKVLSLEIEGPQGEKTQFITEREYQGIRHLSWNEPSFVVRFPDIEATKLVLTQTSKDPIWDWSIIEFRVLAPVSAAGGRDSR